MMKIDEAPTTAAKRPLRKKATWMTAMLLASGIALAGCATTTRNSASGSSTSSTSRNNSSSSTHH